MQAPFTMGWLSTAGESPGAMLAFQSHCYCNDSRVPAFFLSPHSMCFPRSKFARLMVELAVGQGITPTAGHAARRQSRPCDCSGRRQAWVCEPTMGTLCWCLLSEQEYFFFCRRPLPFGGSPLEAYPWTSGESNHHWQSLCVAKNDALPTEPRGHLAF